MSPCRSPSGPGIVRLWGFDDKFKNLSEIAAENWDELWSSLPEFSVDTVLRRYQNIYARFKPCASNVFSDLEYLKYLCRLSRPGKNRIDYLEKVPIPGVSALQGSAAMY
jgi:hypothetical protein